MFVILTSSLSRLLSVRFASVILGLAITGAVTQFTKITVGRPRPGGFDYYAVPNDNH
jgi:hypothetical protein